jgi:hypothetical protein
MLSEKIIELINKIASNKTFNYNGEIIAGADVKSDIDYKFKVTGQRKMMSVGEYYDYLKLEVTITGFNDKFSRLIFGFDEQYKHMDFEKMYKSQLYPFYNRLNQQIQEYLKYFNTTGELIRTTIDNLKFDVKKPENITESRMSKVAIRTTVKDIVYKLKDGKSGEFRLPDVDDGSEYSFINLPFGYSVDLSIEIDENIEGYEIEGDYSSEDDVIEIAILYNPKTLRRNFYNIIGKLNDMVAHELEHGFQYNKGERIYNDPPEDSFGYYTQPHEITAQRAGFRRVAKLRKLPYNDVVRDWFNDHKDVHGLTDDEIEKVIQIIINGK